MRKVIVPLSPTPEMFEAGIATLEELGFAPVDEADVEAIWDSMIQAWKDSQE